LASHASEDHFTEEHNSFYNLSVSSGAEDSDDSKDSLCTAQDVIQTNTSNSWDLSDSQHSVHRSASNHSRLPGTSASENHKVSVHHSLSKTEPDDDNEDGLSSFSSSESSSLVSFDGSSVGGSTEKHSL
jgi:hypothetical protein